MYRHGFLLAIMFCLSQNVVVAYPSGAPNTACDSMTPGHGTPSNVACPFVTIFDKTEMFSNGTLKVTLQAPPSITKPFKGFMVMGFDKETKAVIGTFNISSMDQYSKTLNCGQYDNAATHKNNNTKSYISMDWIPPQGFGGDVEFKTTFLEDKDYNYWVKEISETIRITASEPLPTIPTTDSANTEDLTTTTQQATTTIPTTEEETTTTATTTTKEATIVPTTTEETTTTTPTTTTPKPTTQGAASSVAGWTLLLGVVTLSFLL